MVLPSFPTDHILTGGSSCRKTRLYKHAVSSMSRQTEQQLWKMKKVNFGTTKTAAILRDNSNREGKAEWMAEEQSLYIRSLTRLPLITTTMGSQAIGLQKGWFEALQINSQQVIFSDGKGRWYCQFLLKAKSIHTGVLILIFDTNTVYAVRLSRQCSGFIFTWTARVFPFVKEQHPINTRSASGSR